MKAIASGVFGALFLWSGAAHADLSRVVQTVHVSANHDELTPSFSITPFDTRLGRLVNSYQLIFAAVDFAETFRADDSYASYALESQATANFRFIDNSGAPVVGAYGGGYLLTGYNFTPPTSNRNLAIFTDLFYIPPDTSEQQLRMATEFGWWGQASVNTAVYPVGPMPPHEYYATPGRVTLDIWVGYDYIAVPEAGTWAMMIVGVGGVGMSLRQSRRRRLATA